MMMFLLIVMMNMLMIMMLMMRLIQLDVVVDGLFIGLLVLPEHQFPSLLNISILIMIRIRIRVRITIRIIGVNNLEVEEKPGGGS